MAAEMASFAKWALALILVSGKIPEVWSHASVCETEARKTPSVFQECIQEILFLGDFFTPFIKPDDKLQVYMEPTFKTPPVTIEETICCTKPQFPPMNKSINCLAFEANPAIMHYDPPTFEWQFVPDATITANDFYTLMMIGISSWRTDANLGYPERPPVYWLVTDIKGFNWKTGKQVVHYNSPVTTDTYLILFYKQHHTPIGEVSIAPYASFGDGCPVNFKNTCIFQVEKYVTDQMLKLVGTTWFMVKADGFSAVYSINHLGKSPVQACPLGYPGLKPMADGYNVDCNQSNQPGAMLLTMVTALSVAMSLY